MLTYQFIPYDSIHYGNVRVKISEMDESYAHSDFLSISQDDGDREKIYR